MTFTKIKVTKLTYSNTYYNHSLITRTIIISLPPEKCTYKCNHSRCHNFCHLSTYIWQNSCHYYDSYKTSSYSFQHTQTKQKMCPVRLGCQDLGLLW